MALRLSPVQRRARHPLPAVRPLHGAEVDELRAAADEWIAYPSFTDRALDRYYLIVARLIATLDERRTVPSSLSEALNSGDGVYRP